jgi:hypothetical protein
MNAQIRGVIVLKSDVEDLFKGISPLLWGTIISTFWAGLKNRYRLVFVNDW